MDDATKRWVSVREDDLVDLLRAARQLRATPLVTHEMYVRLGPVMDRMLAQIESLEIERPRQMTGRA